MKKLISKQTYDYLIDGLNNDTYVNYICNTKSKLGSISTFGVRGTEGGMFSGNYCYIPFN